MIKVENILHTIHAIAYLIKNDTVGIDSEISLYKLLFLADRYHLRMYGSTITHDTYYAMKWGPVPSNTRTALGANSNSEVHKKLNEYIEWEGDGFSLIQEPDLDEFSISELEALNAAIKLHQEHPTEGNLVDLTHKFPEWLTPAKKLRLGYVEGQKHKKGAELMDMKLWFTPIEDDYCPASNERLEAAYSYFEDCKC